MHDALLRTKLFVPPVRPTLVRRPRLIEQLNQGLQHEHKLTLISAPAGFGKTTLTADWVAGLQADAAAGSQGAHGVAWLSLEEDDNDPDRFLIYLVAALHRLEGVETAVGNGMLSMLRSARPPPPEDVLTALINSITRVPDRIILVLDDYHLINTQAVDDTLSFLLEHLPFQMHVVIATRSDPNLPLARLRARGQLTEIRAADLRFTAPEAADFLNRVMALDLAAADVAALEARTEGWIAGLQLAAISMRGHQDAAAFVRSFTGSHHFVLDYLVEEVLEHQPPSVQQFLLQTAVLQRLTGALCDALTGREDGQETLESLEQGNLFIIPLDDERRWYRYHHLFGELLRRRLRQAQPDREVVLHHLASAWYGTHGLADEAIEHATRAGDFQQAAQLIELSADAMWGSGEHGKLRRWLARLPEEALAARPYIAIFQASFECANGELDAAERTLTRIEDTLDGVSAGDTAAGRQRLQGRMAAIRAVARSYQGDVPGILQYARQALELLPGDDLTWRGSTAVVLGNVHGFRGDMTAAYEARAEALSACEAAGDVYVAILANLQLAITLRAQGRLRQTIEICQEQMAVAGDAGLAQSRTAGYLSAIWGETLAEMNDLDGALALAQRGFDLTERSGDLPMIGWSFMCLIRVLISREDLADAEALLHRMEQIGRASNLPFWARDQMAAWQARLWLAQDQLAPAIQWAEDRGLDAGKEPIQLNTIGFFRLSDYVVLARILLARGLLDEAARLLKQLLVAAEVGGQTSNAIVILILQALTFQAAAAADRALAPLERALDLAGPPGFVRVFVDEGQPLARLLQRAVQQGIAAPYARHLLAAFAVDDPLPVAPASAQAAGATLVEPLSEREREVLHFIAAGLTNREIAARLYLSLNTVKVHSRNIYGKLGVHNRTKAVAQARALGILPVI